jgi:hypothetical protein
LLFDSAFVDVGTTQRYIYHIAVRHDSATDTLPDIVTVSQPTLVSDSLVLGIGYDSTTPDGYMLFQYSRWRGRVETIEPPPDLRLAVSEPAFAPDGRYLAYVAFPGDETGRGMVMRWPGREIVVQTASDSVPPTDVLSGWAHWTDATHFELYIGVGDQTLIRYRGAVDRRGFTTDTVAVPNAH